MPSFQVFPAALHSAAITVPGDKSISHRALMLGSIANGTTRVSGFLNGEDCMATLAAMSAMGVDIHQDDPTRLTVHGVGLKGLSAPADDLDLGNSGTAMRLMCGLLAGQGFDSVLTGDESLNARPMRRVIAPLAEMGARIASQDGRPPLRINGGCNLHGIEYTLPVASAQVKSAVLLAGLMASGETCVVEPAVTRDHTERMLVSMGIDVRNENGQILIRGGQPLTATDVHVPADLSSAAFVMLAAVLSEKADVLIRNVGVNPTRTGVIDILQAMGADITVENPRLLGAEPVADIRAKSSTLTGGPIDPALVPLAIDEFPVLFVAAAAARGKSTFNGIGELRVKESDRIAAMASGLARLGIDVDEFDDGAVVHGGQFAGGDVDSFGDHRIAMSLAIAGTIATAPVTIANVAAVDTSFPGFTSCIESLGGKIEVGHDD